MPENRPARLATFAAWGLIALGLVLRLHQYLVNRSLWLDEAMLALNIIHKDVAGLLGKLDYDQGAPLGFLLLEKLAAALLGSGERALRLLPLLAGCAALVLFYFLARKILSPVGTLAALALFAVSPTLIYYSSEVKQYSTDVFIALVLLWLASRTVKAPNWALGLVGAIFVWFSHPALFVLAAIGLILLIQNRKNPLPTLALGAGWLASFGILYLVNLRALAGNEFLLGYWSEYFRANSLAALLGLFPNPAGLDGFAPALLVVSICGAGLLFARQPEVAGRLLLVFVFAWVASWVQVYPFAGRMLLFSVPLIYIFLAAAVDWLWELKLRPRFFAPLLALALAGFLLYAPIMLSAERLLSPKFTEHMRPALSVLKESLKPDDQIYIYYWALPAFRYYADPGLDYSAGGSHPQDPLALVAELDQFKGQGRVWILFSHVYATRAYNEKDLLLARLNELGEKKRQFIEPGTSVYLYLYDLK